MPISTDMIVRVAHADVAMQMSFSRSVDYWQRQGESEHSGPALQVSRDCAPIISDKHSGVVIDGDCRNGISAPDGGLIHIYGDLASTISVSEHSEILILGDICSKATIKASGFCHIFVGGDFSGEIQSSGSVKLWIESNFNGTLKTGYPSTEIYVGGNYLGNIGPSERGGLLWVNIRGFASQESLFRIADCGFTEFNATIGRSDTAAGLYPRNGHRKDASGGNSFNRWCVGAEGQA